MMLVTVNFRNKVLNHEVVMTRTVFYYIYHINNSLWPRFKDVCQRNVDELARTTAELTHVRQEVDHLTTQIATLRAQLHEANIEVSHLRNMGRGNVVDDAHGSKRRRM